MANPTSGVPLLSWWETLGLFVVATLITLLLAVLTTVISAILVFLLGSLIFIIVPELANWFFVVLLSLAGFICGAWAGRVAYQAALKEAIPGAKWWVGMSALVWGIGMIVYWSNWEFNLMIL